MEKKYTLIDNAAEWPACIKRLQEATRIAVDLEANSLYSYRERICLIQVATDTEIFIIDPLSNAFDIAPLQELFENGGLEKVFHAADYDLMLLKSRYGWDVKNLFDTMAAARVLGFKQLGLAALLKHFFNVTIDKRYQRADWGKRPLRPDYLAYAANDTRFLLPLRDLLERQLRENNRWHEASSIFQSMTSSIVPVQREFDPERFWKIAGAQDLSPRGLAVLRALYIFRDQEARKRDLPPFKVLNDEIMVQLADASAREARIPEDNPGFRKLHARFGESLVRAIRQGLKNPVPVRSRRAAVKKENGFSYRLDLLLNWRKEKARARGVESDVILSRRAARAIAETNPENLDSLRDVFGVGIFTVEQYGQEILEVLSAANIKARESSPKSETTPGSS